MRGLFLKILREVWLGTLLIGLGLFAAETLFAFILPQIQSGIGTMLAQMPWVRGLISALLGTDVPDDMPTQMLLAIVWVHPVVLALLFAHDLFLGTRVPAAEIDRGTIDVLLSWPLSRRAVYLGESAVWATSGVFILLMALAGHLVGTAITGVPYPPAAHLAMVLVNLYALYVAVGGLTFVLSACSDRRGRVIAIVFAALVGSLLLNVLGQFWAPADSVGFLGVLHYYRPANILSRGAFPTADVAVLLGVGVVLWTLGLVVFTRRSICTV